MINVLCGIIRNLEGQIFIARRRQGKSMAGKWEFPGGKLEPGETEQDCLQRELFEELGMQVKVGEKLGENEHHYENFSIRLIAYRCEFISASYELTDHDKYEWVRPEALRKYELAEADLPLLDLI
jgi:8-oxo-dGTP diphosphatase